MNLEVVGKNIDIDTKLSISDASLELLEIIKLKLGLRI